MRTVFLLAVAVVACAKTETPAADTAAAAAPPPVPAAPAAMTAADMRGTWNGTSKREGNDSTVTWTVQSVTDSTSTLTFPNKTVVAFSTKFDADSMVGVSQPYNDPALPKGAPKVTFRSVGRMKDGKLVGAATLSLASKPDSVLAKSTWEATKAP